MKLNADAIVHKLTCIVVGYTEAISNTSINFQASKPQTNDKCRFSFLLDVESITSNTVNVSVDLVLTFIMCNRWWLISIIV